MPHNTVDVLTAIELFTLKWLTFLLCDSHFNKKKKKDNV